jgi:transcriptional regulator with XRE-family HTH domain
MGNPQAESLRGKILGAMLREVRMTAGRTLRETAEAIGVTPGALTAYEDGRKAISLPELELLAYFLNAPLRQFWSESAGRRKLRLDANPSALIALRQRLIAAQLRMHREASGKTVRQVADQAGLTVARLRSYEEGDRPIPLPELEAVLGVIDRSVEDYLDHEGPVADWDTLQQALETLLSLPPEMREFLASPASVPYLRMGQRLSTMPIDQLRNVAELLLDITL